MKPTRVLIIRTSEEQGKKISARLEDAGYQLARASSELDEAIESLIENYPEVGVFTKKLPASAEGHPYLKIIMAAYMYQRLRQNQLAANN